jgi:hypothetical protein
VQEYPGQISEACQPMISHTAHSPSYRDVSKPYCWPASHSLIYFPASSLTIAACSQNILYRFNLLGPVESIFQINLPALLGELNSKQPFYPACEKPKSSRSRKHMHGSISGLALVKSSTSACGRVTAVTGGGTRLGSMPSEGRRRETRTADGDIMPSIRLADTHRWHSRELLQQGPREHGRPLLPLIDMGLA